MTTYQTRAESIIKSTKDVHDLYNKLTETNKTKFCKENEDTCKKLCLVKDNSSTTTATPPPATPTEKPTGTSIIYDGNICEQVDVEFDGKIVGHVFKNCTLIETATVFDGERPCEIVKDCNTNCKYKNVVYNGNGKQITKNISEVCKFISVSVPPPFNPFGGL